MTLFEKMNNNLAIQFLKQWTYYADFNPKMQKKIYDGLIHDFKSMKDVLKEDVYGEDAINEIADLIISFNTKYGDSSELENVDYELSRAVKGISDDETLLEETIAVFNDIYSTNYKVVFNEDDNQYTVLKSESVVKDIKDKHVGGDMMCGRSAQKCNIKSLDDELPELTED